MLKAGSEAFVLARDEDARHEMGRALTVMGATLHDLKDLEQAESLLVHAIDLVPRGEYQDRWRALERLGEVLAAQGQGADARTAFRSNPVRTMILRSLPAPYSREHRRNGLDPVVGYA